MWIPSPRLSAIVFPCTWAYEALSTMPEFSFSETVLLVIERVLLLLYKPPPE